MNKKKFKRLIISKGGRIINNRKFKYKGVIYLFYYFAKDSKQRRIIFPRIFFRSDYNKTLSRCSKYKIIENQYYSKGYNPKESNWVLIDDEFGFSLAVGTTYYLSKAIIFLAWGFFLKLIFYKKRYADLDKRIKKLNLWSAANRIPIKKERIKKNKPNKHKYFFDAFYAIMLNDYGKRKKKVDILTLDIFIALEKAIYEDRINSYKKTKKHN